MQEMNPKLMKFLLPSIYGINTAASALPTVKWYAKTLSHLLPQTDEQKEYHLQRAEDKRQRNEAG